MRAEQTPRRPEDAARAAADAAARARDLAAKLNPGHPSHGNRESGHPAKTGHHLFGAGRGVLRLFEVPVEIAKVGAETVTHLIGGGIKGAAIGTFWAAAIEGATVGGSLAVNHFVDSSWSVFPNAVELAVLPWAVTAAVGFTLTGMGKSLWRLYKGEYNKHKEHIAETAGHVRAAGESARRTGAWIGARRRKDGRVMM